MTTIRALSGDPWSRCLCAQVGRAGRHCRSRDSGAHVQARERLRIGLLDLCCVFGDPPRLCNS